MLFQGNIRRAALTALIVLISIGLFEVVMHLLLPALTLWESHIISAVFSALFAAVAAFVIFRKQELLNKRLEREVVDRRQAEEKYRDLFEQANDAIFVVDADLQFADVNLKAVELMGYTREELLKMKITDLIPPEQAPRSAVEFEKLKTRGAYENFVGKARRRDGQLVDIEVSSSAIIVNNKVAGSRDIVRDITERKKIEAERERLINELQESLAKVRTLSGLLPICASCKKIRDDKGYWTQIEAYLHEHAAAEFTHGLCPSCMDNAMEEVRKLTKEHGNGG
jgi:PAS domain S-box-containing protein